MASYQGLSVSAERSPVLQDSPLHSPKHDNLNKNPSSMTCLVNLVELTDNVDTVAHISTALRKRLCLRKRVAPFISIGGTICRYAIDSKLADDQAAVAKNIIEKFPDKKTSIVRVGKEALSNVVVGLVKITLKDETNFSIKRITKAVRIHLSNQIVLKSDEIRFSIGKTTIQAKVNDILVNNASATVGIFKSESKIELEKAEKGKEEVTEAVEKDENCKLDNVTLLNYSLPRIICKVKPEKEEDIDYPLFFTGPDLDAILRNMGIRDFVYLSKEWKFHGPKGEKLILEVEKIEDVRTGKCVEKEKSERKKFKIELEDEESEKHTLTLVKEEDKNETDDKEKKGIFLTDKTQLSFISQSDHITIAPNDDVQDIKILKVEILSLRRLTESYTASPKKLCFFVDELRNELAQADPSHTVWKGGPWIVNLKNLYNEDYFVNFKINDVTPVDEKPIPNQAASPFRCNIGDGVSVFLTSTSASSIVLAKTRTPSVAKKVTVEVRLVEKPEGTHSNVTKTELKNFLRSVTTPLLIGDKLTFTDRLNRSFECKITGMQNGQQYGDVHPTLGILDATTHFRFKVKEETDYYGSLPPTMTIIGDSKEKYKGMSVKEIFEAHGLAGYSEEIFEFFENLRDMVEHPETYKKLGRKPPRGVIFYGPTGTGKTALTKIAASLLGAKFSNFGAPEFLNMYVGETERNIRQIWAESEQAFTEMGENSPWFVVGIQELETVFSTRSKGENNHNSYIGQLLEKFDGNDKGKWPHLLILATTNHLELVDPALQRPDRFGDKLEVKEPDEKGALAILKIYTDWLAEQGVLDKDVKPQSIIDSLFNLSGAEIKRIVELAKDSAIKRCRGKKEVIVKMEDFKWALKQPRAPARMNDKDVIARYIS